MNDAVNRFIHEMGATYAEEGDRDVSPILFKADDDPAGMLFELTLPKGEPHPYWRVREREMTAAEINGLAQMKTEQSLRVELLSLSAVKNVGSLFSFRGYVYNARLRDRWNFSFDRVA